VVSDQSVRPLSRDSDVWPGMPRQLRQFRTLSTASAL
jgi:hypothetical protein